MTCDFCVGWSPSQWEAFAKKCSYKERKRLSRPSGSLPPAAATSPRARTSSEGLRPEASSSSLPSGGQAKRGGLRMHLVLRPMSLPLLPLDLGPARGVEVFLVARPVELGRGRLLVRSGRPLPLPLPRSPLPAHHSMLCDVVSRESLRRSAPVLDPPVFPDLRIKEQGRIVGPALGRPALVTGPVVLSLALLPARGQAVESFGGRPRLGRCPPASGHGVTGCGLQTAPGRVGFALALGESSRGPRTATALAGIAFDVTSRGLRTAAGRVDSSCVPLLVREVAVTACSHAIPLFTLVTAVTSRLKGGRTTSQT